MSKPIINFAHANGFPARSYSKLFSLLKNDYKVIFKEMYGHDPRFPIKENWMESGQELIEFIEQNANEPVIGLGHSFGASITLNAALLRPDLFQGIILMDPVMMTGWKGKIISIFNKLNLTQFLSPGSKTKDRQASWKSMEDAESYFKSKTFFKSLDKDCFDDYLKHGLKIENNEVKLVFKVDKEVAIFGQIPTHFSNYNGKLRNMNGVILVGETTNVSKPVFVNRLSNEQGFEVTQVKGGHMFPLQFPDLAAETIKKFSKSINQ